MGLNKDVQRNQEVALQKIDEKTGKLFHAIAKEVTPMLNGTVKEISKKFDGIAMFEEQDVYNKLCLMRLAWEDKKVAEELAKPKIQKVVLA